MADAMTIEIAPDNNTLRRPKRSERCEDTVLAATPPDDGTSQKYYIVEGHYCYFLPDHMNAEDGTLVEPVAVFVQICKVADLRVGQQWLSGCGPIGVLCQAVAKSYGAKKMIGVDISQSRAEFAKKCAACDVYVPASARKER